MSYVSGRPGVQIESRETRQDHPHLRETLTYDTCIPTTRNGCMRPAITHNLAGRPPSTQGGHASDEERVTYNRGLAGLGAGEDQYIQPTWERAVRRPHCVRVLSPTLDGHGLTSCTRMSWFSLVYYADSRLPASEDHIQRASIPRRSPVGLRLDRDLDSMPQRSAHMKGLSRDTL